MFCETFDCFLMDMTMLDWQNHCKNNTKFSMKNFSELHYLVKHTFLKSSHFKRVLLFLWLICNRSQNNESTIVLIVNVPNDVTSTKFVEQNIQWLSKNPTIALIQFFIKNSLLVSRSKACNEFPLSAFNYIVT